MHISSPAYLALVGAFVVGLAAPEARAASLSLDAGQELRSECDGDGKKTSRAEAQCDGDGKKTSRAEAQCDGDGKKTSRAEAQCDGDGKKTSRASG